MAALLASIHAVWMFLAGVALLTFILMKRAYRYFGKPRRSSSSAPIDLQHRPRTAWDGVQQDSLARVERQKVEMHEMSRDLNGQLTTKIVILEKLIGDSQRQIEQMEELISRLEPVGTAGSSRN